MFIIVWSNLEAREGKKKNKTQLWGIAKGEVFTGEMNIELSLQV